MAGITEILDSSDECNTKSAELLASNRIEFGFGRKLFHEYFEDASLRFGYQKRTAALFKQDTYEALQPPVYVNKTAIVNPFTSDKCKYFQSGRTSMVSAIIKTNRPTCGATSAKQSRKEEFMSDEGDCIDSAISSIRKEFQPQDHSRQPPHKKVKMTNRNSENNNQIATDPDFQVFDVSPQQPRFELYQLTSTGQQIILPVDNSQSTFLENFMTPNKELERNLETVYDKSMSSYLNRRKRNIDSNKLPDILTEKRNQYTGMESSIMENNAQVIKAAGSNNNAIELTSDLNKNVKFFNEEAQFQKKYLELDQYDNISNTSTVIFDLKEIMSQDLETDSDDTLCSIGTPLQQNITIIAYNSNENLLSNSETINESCEETYSMEVNKIMTSPSIELSDYLPGNVISLKIPNDQSITVKDVQSRENKSITSDNKVTSHKRPSQEFGSLRGKADETTWLSTNKKKLPALKYNTIPDNKNIIVIPSNDCKDLFKNCFHVNSLLINKQIWTNTFTVRIDISPSPYLCTFMTNLTLNMCTMRLRTVNNSDHIDMRTQVFPNIITQSNSKIIGNSADQSSFSCELFNDYSAISKINVPLSTYLACSEKNNYLFFSNYRSTNFAYANLFTAQKRKMSDNDSIQLQTIGTKIDSSVVDNVLTSTIHTSEYPRRVRAISDKKKCREKYLDLLENTYRYNYEPYINMREKRINFIKNLHDYSAHCIRRYLQVPSDILAEVKAMTKKNLEYNSTPAVTQDSKSISQSSKLYTPNELNSNSNVRGDSVNMLVSECKRTETPSKRCARDSNPFKKIELKDFFGRLKSKIEDIQIKCQVSDTGEEKNTENELPKTKLLEERVEENDLIRSSMDGKTAIFDSPKYDKCPEEKMPPNQKVINDCISENSMKNDIYISISVPLNEYQTICLELMDEFASSLANSIATTGKWDNMVINEQNIHQIRPETTRLILNQLISEAKSSNVNMTKDFHYKKMLLLHGVLKAKDVLIQIGLNPCLSILKEFKQSHGILINDQLDPLVEVIEKRCHGTNTKAKSLKDILRQMETSKGFDVEAKVLIIVRRNATDLMEDLKKLDLSVALLSERNVAEQYDIIKMLDRSKMFIWTRELSTGIDFLLQTMPWTQFSVVFEWEGKRGSKSPWAQHCIRQNIKVISLEAEISPKIKSCLDEKTMQMETSENSDETQENKKSQEKCSLKIVASELIVLNSELHYTLISVCNLECVQRRLRDLEEDCHNRGWADIIIDERTGVLIVPLHQLRQEAAVNKLICHIILLEAQFTSLHILYFISTEYSQGYAFVSKVVQAFVKIAAACAYFRDDDFNVATIYAYGYEQVGKVILKLIESARMSLTPAWKLEEWSNRTWLTSNMSSHEKFLLGFPCINQISAQILLTAMSITDIMTATVEEIASVVRWIPLKVIKMLCSLTQVSTAVPFHITNPVREDFVEGSDENQKVFENISYAVRNTATPEKEIRILEQNVYSKMNDNICNTRGKMSVDTFQNSRGATSIQPSYYSDIEDCSNPTRSSNMTSREHNNSYICAQFPHSNYQVCSQQHLGSGFKENHQCSTSNINKECRQYNSDTDKRNIFMKRKYNRLRENVLNDDQLHRIFSQDSYLTDRTQPETFNDFNFSKPLDHFNNRNFTEFHSNHQETKTVSPHFYLDPFVRNPREGYSSFDISKTQEEQPEYRGNKPFYSPSLVTGYNNTISPSYKSFSSHRLETSAQLSFEQQCRLNPRHTFHINQPYKNIAVGIAMPTRRATGNCWELFF